MLRLLGIRSDQRAPRPSLARIIDDELAAAARLAQPQVVWAAQSGLPGSAVFAPALPLALVVCTLGEAIDARVDAHSQDGDAARAMVLDAVGSAMVEELADRSNGHVCQLAIDAGATPDVRRSPGYGRWELAEQRLVFDLLQPELIGVSLTASCLMTPSKSISYAVPLAGGRPSVGTQTRCRRCGLMSCAFRVQPNGEAQ